MERMEAIRRHPLFQQEYGRLWAAETDRPFCRHTMEHLLDVARLMYIYALEDGADLSRDIIYAAALLHDIGRHQQLADGTPHEIAGARLAGEVLWDCGFESQEIVQIQRAIGAHRHVGEEDTLSRYLYWADKRSRPCYDCAASAECNWPNERRNLELSY